MSTGWTKLQAVSFPPAQAEVSPRAAPSQNYDDALIERTLAGEQETFEQLMQRHRWRVQAIARKFFRRPETVEDVVQETFAKAYFKLASYRQGASFEHWLARIAFNNCYDELRRRKHGELLLSEVTDDQLSWLDNQFSGVSFARYFNERAQPERAELAEKLLASLPRETRLTLILLHVEGFSVNEVAQMLGWSESKVKIRAFRARHELRRLQTRWQLREQRKNGSAIGQ